LYDYNARFYDPYLARFISADTIVPDPGNPQAFNRYAYCINNPLKYVDPTGHTPEGPPKWVCSRAPNAPGCGEASAESQDSSPLTAEKAQELFDKLAGRDDIAFRYPQDGCYARAHLMIQTMQEEKAILRKVWAFKDPEGSSLWVSTPDASTDRVEWWYHVAPAALVIDDSVMRYMVFDPALFDKPVTLKEWREIQHNVDELKFTKLGESPDPEKWPDNHGGSGYWPGPDPEGGVDAHATDTMERYKKQEPLSVDQSSDQ
jgi:hypothetical protein